MTIIRKQLVAVATGTFLMVSLALALPALSVPADSTTKGLAQADLEKVQGEVGIVVIDTARKKQYLLNQDKHFPMQSVCKLPVSLAVLRLADAGKVSVRDRITIRKADVLSLRSPIKESIKGNQSDFSIRELIRWMICDSDNTACDVLIGRAGGASEVTRILTEAGVRGIGVDRPEKTLQSDSLHISTYLADLRDTSTPEGMVNLLQDLYRGKLLSKNSTAIILEDLFNCKTGLHRIKSGLPVGWKLAHKTGTGEDVSGQNTATNDVGVIVGPKGETIYIAVFIKGSRAKIEVREALMAKVAAKAVAGAL